MLIVFLIGVLIFFGSLVVYLLLSFFKGYYDEGDGFCIYFYVI